MPTAFAHRVQAVQRVVCVELRETIAAGNVNFLLQQIPVVVAHLVIRAHAPTMVAVVIDDRAAFPTGVARACVSRALANLRELPPRVVEQFVVNRNRRPELLLRHAAARIIANPARICARRPITEITSQALQMSRYIVGVRYRVVRWIGNRSHMTGTVVSVAHRVSLRTKRLAPAEHTSQRVVTTVIVSCHTGTYRSQTVNKVLGCWSGNRRTSQFALCNALLTSWPVRCNSEPDGPTLRKPFTLS